MDAPNPGPPDNPQLQEPKHWLLIAGTSLLLGTLIYAGMLFPFAVTDGLLGLNCHGWVKGPRGAASLLFILGWGCTVAIMAGRVYGRTETLEDLLQARRRFVGRGKKSTQNSEQDGQADAREKTGDHHSP